MNDSVRYAKKDLYAEVEEEGGKINRLVATAGEVVPAAYAEYVNDSDTTTEPSVARAATLGRSTSARRARAGKRTEVSHEAYREAVGGIPGQVDSELAGATPPVEPATDVPEGAKSKPKSRAKSRGSKADK